MAFEVGDKVYVPEHGVGIVRDIADAEAGPICIISILESGLVHSVPLASLGLRGERALIPARGVDLLYAVLRGREAPLDDEPQEQRDREYAHWIRSGDPLMVANALRDLARLGAEGTLSDRERELHDRARSLVVQEIAVVRGVDERVVEGEIDAILAGPAGSRAR